MSITNIESIAIAMLAVIALAAPPPSVAEGSPGASRAKPSSFVPHSRTNRHIYGTPISAPIAGHAKSPHRKHAQKKPPDDQ